MANYPTPHIHAKPGDFGKTVLMPGDPLRSKFIAENFLENAVLVNNVRGIHGYTGTYRGVKVSVMFKSPTSTAVDRRMADRMARIANISLEELGQTIFSASISDDKPADVLLFTDFKDFHIADHDFGVSQITCVDSNRMMQRKDEFLSVMRKTMEERGYTLMILMLTDVLLEGTHLLYLGDEDIITQAFGVQLKDHTCFLPGVVSRKKQVIPSLTALWG